MNVKRQLKHRHTSAAEVIDQPFPTDARPNLPCSSEMMPVASLKIAEDGVRRYSDRDEKAAVRIVRQFGVPLPVVIGPDNAVLIGELIARAARRLNLDTIPVTRAADLGPVRLKAMGVAYNRLLELGSFDQGQLREAMLEFEAEIPGFELEDLGFETAAIDLVIADPEPDDPEEEEPAPSATAVSRLGDLWLLGRHRVVCGDAREPSMYANLLTCSAHMVFTDPPFGCAIDGFVAGKGRHREFVMGSRDMAPDALGTFFSDTLNAMQSFVAKGAVVELVIDWRSLHILLDAAVPVFGKLLNLAVWAKDRAGMGSFLRSQHELILIFKVNGGKTRNNVELGRHGRDRSNVWQYPSAKTASKGSDEGNMLAHHPTPKPVRMVADAILDCTRRGDVVLDPFLGSGTTLIAAEKVGRRCFGADLDPLYVDLIVRRWQAWTGDAAIHAETGISFDETAAERAAGQRSK